MDYFKMTFAFPRGRLWMPQFGCDLKYGHFVWTGRKVTDWDPQEIAIYQEPYVHWDHASTFSFRIVSDRVKELFESQFPAGLQFLPVRLQKDDGTDEVSGFFGLHLLNVHDCLSIEHPGKSLAGEKVLARNKLPDFDLFIVNTLCEFVVTNKVMNAVKAANFTGFSFEPVSVI